MVVDLHNEARQVLDEMKWFLVDVDEERRLIEGIVSRFAINGQGNACVVVGKCISGRTTTVKSVVEKFDLSQELRVISVGQLGSDKNAVKLLTDEEDVKSCVLIIEDADELAVRQRQSLLYLLLNTVRSGDHQWLVFLMVQHQDFITSLEKRVRSRLPTARIVFHSALNLNEYVTAFEKFLGKERAESSNEWKTFVKQTVAESAVMAELNYMFSTDSSYALLKRMTSAFLCLYLTNEIGKRTAELLAEAVEMIMPREHSLANIVKSLSLLSLCVLLCVFRRLRSCPVYAAVGYRKIVQDLRRVGNTVDSRVRVSSDLSVYKEIDRLVELGILVADMKSNTMAFRRCSLNVHTKTLDKMLREVKLPASIEYWFDTQAA